jgi:arginase family enzyme
MCLSAACGRWDSGFEPSLEPAQVLMCGVRDLDAGERVLVETAGIGNARPSEVVPTLRGRRVYVHLDLDVLDPSVLPAQFAVPNGLSDTGLRTLLSDLKDVCEIVGLEVTAFEAPEDERERAIRTALVASIVGALLPA